MAGGKTKRDHAKIQEACTGFCCVKGVFFIYFLIFNGLVDEERLMKGSVFFTLAAVHQVIASHASPTTRNFE